MPEVKLTPTAEDAKRRVRVKHPDAHCKRRRREFFYDQFIWTIFATDNDGIGHRIASSRESSDAAWLNADKRLTAPMGQKGTSNG